MISRLTALVGLSVLVAAPAANAITTFSTDFNAISNAEVASHVLTNVGTFSGGSSTNGAGALASGPDRYVTLSNLDPLLPQTLTLNFTLAAPTASFTYSFWASSNAAVVAGTGVVVTLVGPSGTQSVNELGLGPAIAANPNPGGVNHTGVFAGGGAGAYTLTFGNLPANNGFRLDDVSISAVPEPETYALLLSGLAALGLLAKRRR